MAIYTHARQFPHLAGKTDPEIRVLARRAMGKHPALILVKRLRDVAIILAMIIANTLLRRFSGLHIGAILMLIGGVGSAVIICWNLVWLNRVMYRLTKREVAEAPTR